MVTPLWTSMPSREEQNSSNLLHSTDIGETRKIFGPLGVVCVQICPFAFALNGTRNQDRSITLCANKTDVGPPTFHGQLVRFTCSSSG